ncbi:unnamed protein product [Mycena citricolor]|uniref:Uncharacterized protein n=1 Tax=Mycena citricolor TaxID=2018698 RepID=A0AAD2Q719_9AGAR|nr:unnamed protein product [Mycena citricolor]
MTLEQQSVRETHSSATASHDCGCHTVRLFHNLHGSEYGRMCGTWRVIVSHIRQAAGEDRGKERGVVVQARGHIDAAFCAERQVGT